MIKNFFIFLLIAFFQLSFSQVGIGTTNPSASSALEINSSNTGLLIPRVPLTSTSVAAPITSPATSLLIYNTNSLNDVTPGFYYWEGSWKPLKSASSTSPTSGSEWNLGGNTVTASDYIGTNNYFPLIFKVNNTQFARFHPNGGMAFGNGAVASDSNSVAIGTSATTSTNNQAVAIGPSSNASYQSVAIGLNAATTGNTAVAIGSSTRTTAQNAIAIGTSSNAAQDGTAIGNNAKATGYQSSAFGNGTSATGQNSTVIGNGATTSQANAIVIGTSGNKTGIGTNTPDERLHVAGSVKIVDGTQANNYVLTSDANGKASWKDPNSTKAYGEIYRSSNLTLPSGAINFGTNGVASNVSLNGDNIQVQTTGIYRITYTISIRKNSGSQINPEFFLTIYGSEIPGTRTFTSVSNGDSRTVSLTKLVTLNAYQAVSVHSSLSNNDTSILANGATLSVELVK